jgi:hypothetical protein
MVSIILLTLRQKATVVGCSMFDDMPRVCDGLQCPPGACTYFSRLLEGFPCSHAYKQVRCRTTSRGTQNAPVDSTVRRSMSNGATGGSEGRTSIGSGSSGSDGAGIGHRAAAD